MIMNLLSGPHQYFLHGPESNVPYLTSQQHDLLLSSFFSTVQQFSNIFLHFSLISSPSISMQKPFSVSATLKLQHSFFIFLTSSLILLFYNHRTFEIKKSLQKIFYLFYNILIHYTRECLPFPLAGNEPCVLKFLEMVRDS